MPKLEDLNLGKPGNADEPMKVDAKGSLCPGPIMSLHDAFNKAIKGQQIIVEATDPGFKKDVTAWSAITGNDITSMTEKDGIITAVMVKKNEFNEIDVPPKENMMTIIVFSDELDKAVAAFNISLGALAVGMEVHLFFTFWGLSMIRKKTGDSKPIDAMLPKGEDRKSVV